MKKVTTSLQVTSSYYLMIDNIIPEFHIFNLRVS